MHDLGRLMELLKQPVKKSHLTSRESVSSLRMQWVRAIRDRQNQSTNSSTVMRSR